MTDIADKPKVGLILAGGGARAAYQVGVLKAVAEMLPPDCPNPFPILSGTSAGAINATTLAIYATRFHEGVRRLVHVWQNFHVDQVFRADVPGVLANGLRWFFIAFLPFACLLSEPRIGWHCPRFIHCMCAASQAAIHLTAPQHGQ